MRWVETAGGGRNTTPVGGMSLCCVQARRLAMSSYGELLKSRETFFLNGLSCFEFFYNTGYLCVVFMFTN